MSMANLTTGRTGPGESGPLWQPALTQDEAAGKHHHRRASRVFQRAAIWAPLVETAGFLTFVTYYLNVPLLQPWQDWLGWSFATTVVLVIILGQTWLVRHAGRSHNHAR